MSDALLVDAARTGDRRSLAELLERHRPLLLALCRRALRDEVVAEDVAQDACLAAMLGIERLGRPERFGPWLAGIGLNLCRRRLRARGAAHCSWEAMAGGVRWQGAVAEATDPAEALANAEVAERVRGAVSMLPTGQRRAVALVYFAGMTCAEAAVELGIEVGAVKSRLHKGRAALRRRLWWLWRTEVMTTTDYEDSVCMDVRDVIRVREGAEQGWPAAHVVILAETDGERRLPIWVGEAEAVWLALALEKVEAPRPGPHALTAQVVAAMGGRVREVRVSRLAGDVFYAELVTQDGRGVVHRVDARPSDALILAQLMQVPVLAARDVLEATQGARSERLHRVLEDEGGSAVSARASELVVEWRQSWAASMARARAARR
ncbi:MAG: sigma-70 family polymerase sigma factor [Chloroflexi bacterium]|nr:sigma-70 family polymerase sigma factor [Chloroflexota bacterium]